MGQRLIISEEEKKTILGLHSEPSLKKRLFEGQGVGFMVGEPNGLQIRKEEPTEAEIRKEKSLAKAQTEFTKIAKELKANVGKIKAIVAKKSTERTKEEEMLLAKMKELTQRKNQLKTKFSKLEDED